MVATAEAASGFRVKNHWWFGAEESRERIFPSSCIILSSGASGILGSFSSTCAFEFAQRLDLTPQQPCQSHFLMMITKTMAIRGSVTVHSSSSHRAFAVSIFQLSYDLSEKRYSPISKVALRLCPDALWTHMQEQKRHPRIPRYVFDDAEDRWHEEHGSTPLETCRGICCRSLFYFPEVMLCDFSL